MAKSSLYALSTQSTSAPDVVNGIRESIQVKPRRNFSRAGDVEGKSRLRNAASIPHLQLVCSVHPLKMANNHFNHTTRPLDNGQWPQAPQHQNLTWNPLNPSLPRASYTNTNYYASLQSTYGAESLSISSNQQRSAPTFNRQFSSAYPHLDSTPLPTPAIRSFRQGPGGPHRCAHSGCLWSGPSPKALEIHKMDHHLIFPPGWKPRKGPPDGGGGYAPLLPSSFPTDFSSLVLICQSPVRGSP